MSPTVSYLALGDSYTIGEGVDPDQRWPVRLVAALRARGLPIAEPRIVATTGWTMTELEEALDEQGLVPGAGPPWGVVSLLIGVNDQYRGLERERFAADHARLLDRAIGLAGGEAARVFAVSIPDWGATPFGADSGRDLARVAEEIDWCNAIQALRAAELGVAWHDVTSLTRRAGSGPECVVDDGLHPAPRLHAAWAEQLAAPVAHVLAPARSDADG